MQTPRGREPADQSHPPDTALVREGQACPCCQGGVGRGLGLAMLILLGFTRFALAGQGAHFRGAAA